MLRIVSIFLRLFVLLISIKITTTFAQAEILWDNWYTVTDHGAPNSYYNEKVEVAGDHIKIQVNTWIADGKTIHMENLGASAKNTPLLEPLLYNFRTKENGIDKSIDGTIINGGKVFSIKVTHGTKVEVPLRAEMLPKLILASFFPVWVHKNYKRISGVQPIEFTAILEDQVEKQVPIVKGTAYEMNADDFSKKTNTRKLRIEFGKVVWFWYVTKKGDAIRIDLPRLDKQINQVSKEKALKFL